MSERLPEDGWRRAWHGLAGGRLRSVCSSLRDSVGGRPAYKGDRRRSVRVIFSPGFAETRSFFIDDTSSSSALAWSISANETARLAAIANGLAASALYLYQRENKRTRTRNDNRQNAATYPCFALATLIACLISPYKAGRATEKGFDSIGLIVFQDAWRSTGCRRWHAGYCCVLRNVWLLRSGRMMEDGRRTGKVRCLNETRLLRHMHDLRYGYRLREVLVLRSG